MLIECAQMDQFRNSCALGPFVRTYRNMYSSVKIYAMYLNDDNPKNVKKKALSLYHMQVGWNQKMNIKT